VTVISGITCDPGTILLVLVNLMLKNIFIIGLIFAHATCPNLSMKASSSANLHFEILVHTLFEVFWSCQRLLLIICANCFASRIWALVQGTSVKSINRHLNYQGKGKIRVISGSRAN